MLENVKKLAIRLGKARIGDNLEAALSVVGITKDRVENLLGKRCRCKERQEWLNQLGGWAQRVLSGKTDKAEEYLTGILDQIEEYHRAREEARKTQGGSK